MQKYLPMFEPLVSTISPPSIFSLGDSHAKTLAKQGSARAWLLASVLVFGSSSPESLAKFDLELCCWRMSKQSPRQEKKKTGKLHPQIWEWSLIRWPRWGIAHDGELSRLLMTALPTSAIDGSAWPTPNAEDYYHRSPPEAPHISKTGQLKLNNSQGQRSQVRLSQTAIYYEKKKDWHTPIAGDALKGGDIELKRDNGLSAQVRWATPKARDNQPESLNSAANRNTPSLTSQVAWSTPTARDYKGVTGKNWNHKTLPDQLATESTQGQLNPEWVEMLMGYPPNWTALD